MLPLSNTDILKTEEMNFELLSQARNSDAILARFGAILAQFWRNYSGAILTQIGAIRRSSLTPRLLRARRAYTRRR